MSTPKPKSQHSCPLHLQAMRLPSTCRSQQMQWPSTWASCWPAALPCPSQVHGIGMRLCGAGESVGSHPGRTAVLASQLVPLASSFGWHELWAEAPCLALQTRLRRARLALARASHAPRPSSRRWGRHNYDGRAASRSAIACGGWVPSMHKSPSAVQFHPAPKHEPCCTPSCRKLMDPHSCHPTAGRNSAGRQGAAAVRARGGGGGATRYRAARCAGWPAQGESDRGAQ